MKPRADFACLSKRCLSDDGAATVYELPVDASHCPMGHKRLRRLFNAVNVRTGRSLQPDADWRLTSTSHAQRSDALLQDSFDQRDKRRSSSREMPSFGVDGREQDVSLPGGKRFIVPSAQDVGAMFGLPGKGEPMTQMDIHRSIRQDTLGVPALLHGINQQGVPTVVVGRER